MCNRCLPLIIDPNCSQEGHEDKLPGYSSWKQVAGYFDGDGNVGIEVVKRVLRLKIRFVDTWLPQVDSIRKFLARHRISTSKIGRDEKREKWQAAYRLDVTEVRSVLKVAKAMLPLTVKKWEDLRIAIDYLEGRITGNQAIAAFNEEVRTGRRRGKIRGEGLPHTRIEGLRLSQLDNARNARAAYAVNVDPSITESIRKDHRDLKLSYISLSKKYGYTTHVIRRILGAP